MGLDLYAGSLTRYYSGDWETIAQRRGRETGQPVEILRPDPTGDEMEDPEEILAAVLEWREGIALALDDALHGPLDWDERLDAPYFTDKPGWDGYGDLVLWAAYADHEDLTRPVDRVVEWREDPAFLRSSQEGSDTACPQLLLGAEIWFPVDQRFVFEGPDPSDEATTFGSVQQLIAELEALNARTWGADEATVAAWYARGFDPKSPLEAGAQFALALFLDLAQKAVAHRLILKLDY